MTKRVYYAHPISWYGTVEEQKDLELIQKVWKERDILNPNQDPVKRMIKILGSATMDYFYGMVATCDSLVARPFRDGALGAGVAAEISLALNLGLPVFCIDEHNNVYYLSIREFHNMTILSREQTRARIMERVL